MSKFTPAPKPSAKKVGRPKKNQAPAASETPAKKKIGRPKKVAPPTASVVAEVPDVSELNAAQLNVGAEDTAPNTASDAVTSAPVTPAKKERRAKSDLNGKGLPKSRRAAARIYLGMQLGDDEVMEKICHAFPGTTKQSANFIMHIERARMNGKVYGKPKLAALSVALPPVALP